MIYLDYLANTPVDPRVLEVYCRTEQNFIGNPNSTHCAGQAARQEMNRVTGLIAAQLGGCRRKSFIHPAQRKPITLP